MTGAALFPTPLFIFHPPDVMSLCDEVTALLLAERGREPGGEMHDYGGNWHSVPDLAARPNEIWQRMAQEFVDAVSAAFRDFASSEGHDLGEVSLDVGVQMWGTVTPPGAYSAVHDHHDVDWSAVFFADIGNPGPVPSGCLGFVDPRRVPPTCAGVTLYPSTFTVRPENGMLAVFPGWLQRYAHPYGGDRPRVSVAASVQVERR
jgi:hypothetical protein